jgi:hypothetical protein
MLLLFLLASLLFNLQVHAQSGLPYQWYINVNAGLSQIYGDIENETDPIGKLNNESGIGYGVKAGGYISPVFSWRLQFLHTNFEAQKDASNLSFETGLSEFQLGANVSFSNLFFGPKQRLVNVYGFAGVGTLFYRSKLSSTLTGEMVNGIGYSESGEKSSLEVGVSFPLGAGLDFRLSDRFYINLETALRFTTTDKPDAAEKGANNDAFYYTSLGLSYHFKKAKQPKKVVVPPTIAEKPKNKYEGTYINLAYLFPQELNSLDEFVMTSHISKGDIKGKAELTQILPIGFNVLDTNISNARTKFRNFTLSLYWDEIPADTAFDVSYRVKLDKIFGSLPMTSILYFEETGEEYKFKTDIFIKRKIVAEPIAVVDKKPSDEEMKSPSEKVEFRIQLRASYNLKLSTDSLAKLFGLDQKITEEKIGLWYKYSVGSFKTYEEAKIYRLQINGKPGIKDPFIIAYYDGKRLNKLSELRDLAPEALPGGEQAKPKFKENGYCWRVQILAMQSKRVSPSALQSINNIEEVVNEEIYYNWSKYTVGDCLTKQQALDLRIELVKKGLDGSFLVKYHDGVRAELE